MCADCKEMATKTVEEQIEIVRKCRDEELMFERQCYWSRSQQMFGQQFK